VSSRVHRAPLALASDGAVLVNVHHLAGDTDPRRLLEVAEGLHAPLFVAIVATARETRRAAQRLDDAATDVAASILGSRMSTER